MASRLSCVSLLAVAALVGVPSTTLPGVYHDVEARGEGKEHIGSGIYFSMAEIRNKLTTEELEIVARAKKDPAAVVRLFTQKLWGDYGDWVFYPLHSSRDASEFLCSSQVNDRGVCRHKSRVLAAILNEVGVQAELQSGTTLDKPYAWHVWVYIPALDKVADPTSGIITDAPSYQSKYTLYVDGIPLPSGWY